MRTTVADGPAAVQEPGNSKRAVEAKVNEQYDSDASMAFYEHVMGGGGDDIHYGIFRKEKDGLKQSSQNSVEELARMAVECGALKQGGDNSTVYVLDLGSGKGGAARWLAKKFGCHVTCFNLGERQNALNLERAEAAGIGSMIDCHLGSFNEPLPIEWTDRFDMIWSQEAFCHCVDHSALLAEVQRALKPGGTIVFSDIMQGDAGGDCSSFTGQNVVTKLATPQMYKDAIASCGMRLHEHRDLTEHLTPYFKCMLEAVRESKLPLQMKGVSMTRLQAYEEDLAVRFDAVKQRYFAWGMFSAQNLFSNDALLNGALNGENLCQDQLEECINAQYDSEASMTFYQYTMGGGSDYVHYGMFKSPDDDLKTASHNTVELLAELARRVSSLGLSQGKNVRVLDLGAGKGGAARYLAATFGCHVTCYNIGENQNNHNLEKAKEEGLEGLIACRKGNFNTGLPAEWTTSFDLVWSQEAFCHAKCQLNLLKEIKRVLKPGGSAVFTDIMRMDTHTASVPDLTSLARHDSLYEEPYSPTVAGVVTSPDDTSPGPTEADTPESPDTPTSSIPIPARNTTSVMASAASASSLATSFCSTSVPRDFPANEKVKRLSKKTVHASSPDMYVCNIQDAGLQLVEYRDLSDQLVPFYSRMLDEVKANEPQLVEKGISAKRVESTLTDLAHRMGAVQDGGLAWGAFTFRKPANSHTLIIGGGPLGALVAMRMSQSGVSNVTLKVLPTSPHQVQEMAALAGVRCVEKWEDVDNTSMWGTIIIAVKTHWLPHIALEMSCMQVTFENLCMVYNGYTQTPEYFIGPGCTRAVVPQSFSFQQDALITWDVKHGNTMNPWTLPHGKPSATVVGQLAQSSISAVCDPSFHRSAFFKFCVNNAANLLSVIEQKCCRDLCADPSCAAMMSGILYETLDILENDLFFAALVPMHRELFIKDVIHSAKGSVRSYDFHFPSSYQHYKQMKLVDTRALNGFVVRKGRELSKPAPINEYVARQVIAISAATMRGVPRPEWDLRVKLSAAKRLVYYAGLDVNVWGHASARELPSEDTDPALKPTDYVPKMLLSEFGETFSEARASTLQQLPFHPRDLTEEQRAGANITAIVLHGAVYSVRSDVGCVLHTHSPYATAMAAADVDFNSEIIQDAMQFVGKVAYHDFGGVADEEEEMELVSKVAKDADVVVLRNHGILVVGEDIERAFSRLYYYERACQCQLLVMGAGKTVRSAGAIGVKHTVDWYRTDGKDSAHAEWKAHMRELLHKENAAANPVRWYE